MKRILALDSIRGLLLVIMTINHLIWTSGGRSVLQYFSQQPLGQFGAAEGFVLISGLLAGAVYSSRKYSHREASNKVLRRALTIYKYHLTSLFIVMLWFTFCAFTFPAASTSLGGSFDNLIASPVATLLLSTLLINKPDYLEILPLYVMFMLILPLALYAFRRGYLWLFLAVSVLVWAFSGSITSSLLSPALELISPDLNVQFGYFDPFAWQLLFVSGAALGYSQRQGTLHWYHPAMTVLAGLFAAGMFAAHHGAFVSWGIHQGVLYHLADKPELGWLRVLNLAAWVYLIAAVIRVAPNALAFAPLSYIGKHSLQVFTWQAVLIFVSAPFLTEMRITHYYSLLVLALTATLWAAAWWQESGKQTTNSLPKGAVLASTVALLLTASLASIKQEQAPIIAMNESYPLTVKIKDVKDEEAGVMLLIFEDTDNLMGAPSHFAGPYTADQVREGITLNPMPSGYYAIMAFQDLDGNNTLSFGAGGMPTEGFGYSNNPPLQGPPTMDVVKFAHNKAQDQTIYMLNLY
ncbi:OpgC domain-containing protein [Enterovibrio sp. 27052020O]|uniref:OpgC domain-containing protein n=1 Tax=Enterovibrio sp. 27052020O TaxID=3241166 RepID=UPI00388ED283